MTLYQINEQLRAIADGAEFDEETGEIFDEQAIMELQIAREDKIEGIACLIKESKAMAEALKAERESLYKRQKAEERKVESLKKLLTVCMEDGEKFKSARAAISWRTSRSVEVQDEGLIPAEYLKVVTEPNRTAIKLAIERGEEVPGATIVQKNNVVIK